MFINNLFRVPTLHKVLETAVQCGNYRKSKNPAVSLAVANVLFIRNQRLSAVAKINTIRLKLKGVPARTINHLNRLHMTVSYRTAVNLMDSE